MKRSWIVLFAVCLMLSGCARNQKSPACGCAGDDCLTIYCPLEERIWSPFVREFQERSGVWIQVEQGSQGDLLEAFRNEPEKCDVLFGFDMQTLQEEETMLAEITPSEQQTGTEEPLIRSACVFQELPVIVCNPHLLQKNLPTGLGELSDSRWQGTFSVVDPSGSSFGRSVLTTLAQLNPDASAEEALCRFADNSPSFSTSSEQILREVNDGTYLLGVVSESSALEAVSHGASISVIYPEEGSYLFPFGAAISAQTEHPEQARAFLAFLMGEHTQRHAWEYLHLRPADGSAEYLPENTCFPQLSSTFSQRRLMKLWQKVREDCP